MIRNEISDGLAIVTIDRAAKHNALTLAMRGELRDLFAAHRRDPAVRAVLLRASGDKAFCAGADVEELAGNDTRVDFDAFTNPMILNLHELGKPTVCEVNGVAAGLGWSLALACDLVVAARHARFSQVFRNVALAPDGGATWFLSRLVGVGRAKELVYSARFVGADEAQSMGLLHEVVEGSELSARALAVARDLASGPTLALGQAKRLFDLCMGPPLAQHLAQEADMQCALVKTSDHQAALAAFASRSKPVFQGR